jgi:hypothetical protein
MWELKFSFLKLFIVIQNPAKIIGRMQLLV